MPGQRPTIVFSGHAPRANGGTDDAGRCFSLKKSLWIQLITIQAVLNTRTPSLNAHPEVLMSQK
ncbi:hypothetical protein DMB83_018495 [Pectobacterium aquaticum]|nr:hypothetical protein DMB83_018495 [Pectobacterium aquaticum]